MNDNPVQALIARSPMHIRQFILVILCCLINLSDGYDVLSLALAAPQLTKEWGVAPQMLGVAFSATSIGLVLGAFVVAPVADRLGRRSVVLTALLIITIAHWCLAVSNSIWMVAALRFCKGIGLGTLVVSLNVLVAEFSNERWRNVLLGVLHTGFSLGMAVGGATAAWVMEPFGWRYIFVGGGLLNGVVLLFSIVFLLESPEYLTTRQPRNALARVNAVLAKLKRPPLESLPQIQMGSRPKITVAALLAPDMRRTTILIWIASLTYAIVGYFLMNWKPQILVNAGLSPTQASYVGVINGAFGTLGHLTIGLLTRWIDETRLTAIYFAMVVVVLVVFGTIPANPVLLLGTSGVLTLFTVGAYTGLFLVAIKIYSAEMRNTGVGFVVGWGRVGAIIGPMLGGLLIGASFDRVMTFAVFASIAVIPVMSMFLAAGATLRPAPSPAVRPATSEK
ncbi:MAG TPA: MFS transporter [Steroidobacter sp.]|uniref:MFS transporter n=1 Tax=Steroidobacter sp. TaxID=1978227 RepID=UPI002ED80AA5